MGWRDLLRIPETYRRARSETRDEIIEPAEGPSGVGPDLPHFAGSTPDLGTLTSPQSSPLTSRIRELKDRSVSDRFRSVFSKKKSKQLEPPGPAVKTDVIDENKSNLKTLASSTAKMVLRGVKESADACPQLKSVLGCLCFVLDNYEKTIACRQMIESLLPRVEELVQSLSAPVPEGEVNEKKRRDTLERKLNNIVKDLIPLAQRDKVTQFLTSTEAVDKLSGMVDDIRDAMMEYQTSLQQDLFHKTCQLMDRADLILLDRMRHVSDAGFISGNRQGCMKGTRRDVLFQLETWLNDEEDKRVFWLNGLAGTGKSTIAQTFAEINFADGKLGASFFCSRYCNDRSDLNKIFPTLAFQLARRYPHFREELLLVLTANSDVGQGNLCSQMENLIVRPFEKTRIQTLVIIDALDECRDDEPASALLSILSRYLQNIPFVKFLITGRPEPRIRSGFRLESLQPHTDVLRLHEVARSSVDSDIRLFFKIQLINTTKNRSDLDLPEKWPDSVDLDTLCEKAAGLFIYASTVVRFVASKNHQPTKRLAEIIALPSSTIKEGRAGIDSLYTEVLQQAFSGIESDDREFYSSFGSVVGAVVLVFNPLSVITLSDLLGVSNISTVLRSLHSLLIIPTSQPDPTPIYVLHKSFPDFLTDPQRCIDQRFFVDPSIHHRRIALSCLRLMKERLKKNICQLDEYTYLNQAKHLPAQRNAYIGDTLEYACCFWATHLANAASNGSGDNEVFRAIDEFFTTCFLFWVEVLSLMRNLDIGVYALNYIDKWYTMIGIPCKWTNDSQRFLLEHFDAICDSPSQIYHFALPFCPSSSWLHKCYSGELSQAVKVVKGTDSEWGTCSRTVTFNGNPQALSCHSNTIAVGLDLWSDNIIILNAITGSQATTLSSHTSWVRSLVFSLDGNLLVSGSSDTTVKLWDVQTGGVVKTFHGHTDRVRSVSISADCTRIASGSDDQTICLWNIGTGDCNHFITLQNVGYCVSFSPIDSECLVFISEGKFQQWEINGGQNGSTYCASHIAFSLDHTQFALCNEDVVTVHDSGSEEPMAELHLPDHNTAKFCCFSPNGNLVAVSSNKVVYVWSISNSVPHLVAMFAGHSNNITSLVFSSSSSLISTAHEGSVKFWQIRVSSTDPAETDLKSTLFASASIEFVSLQSEEGFAISGDSDGVVKVWDILTGLCRTSFQTPAKDSFWGDAKLIGNKLLLIWGLQGNIHIWDSEKGQLPQTLVSVRSSGIRISGDRSKVFNVNKSGGICTIQTWSMWTWVSVGEVKLEKGKQYYLDSFHADGSRVWVQSEDFTTKGWDFETLGSSPIQLSNSFPERTYFDFIDGTFWGIDLPFVKNTVTGKEVFRLCGKHAKPGCALWDGKYLVVGYDDGGVLILDFRYLCLQ